jgi:SCP-2 sterol transfer family
VSEFLSDEWITALAHAAPARNVVAGAVDAVARLVVEPVVRGVPGRDEVRYRIAFDEIGCEVTARADDAARADVYLETDYPTAMGLARGDTNAQAALADGRLRVTGDVARLAAHASALPRLGDLFAAVRATTTYPGADSPS